MLQNLKNYNKESKESKNWNPPFTLRSQELQPPNKQKDFVTGNYKLIKKQSRNQVTNEVKTHN